MSSKQEHTTELLAPAGHWESLRAAVANGADAVYFGLGDFNARRRAVNFALDELPAVMDFLHRHNVRGYVAFNTLIFPEELGRAADYAAAIAQAGADAVIVQDLGLAALVHALAPSLPLHASTQMTLSHPRAMDLLKAMGVTRVILPRELPLPEIAAIAAATDLELEVFVHGALCMSYSGQCQASGALMGRSANRGQCAQACRLPYELIVDGKVIDTQDRRYLLSPRDLAAHDLVADLVRLGVAGLKIEGRLKSPQYVAAATGIYRAAIDAAAAGKAFRLSHEQEQELAEGFSRGFCHGFLKGADHGSLVHGLYPDSRGVRVGTVVGKSPAGLMIQALPSAGPGGDARTIDPPLKGGDGVVFGCGESSTEQGGRVYSVRPCGGGRYELTFGAGDLKLSTVSAGDEVWKSDDPAVHRRLTSSYARDIVVHRQKIHAAVRVEVGGELVVRFTDASGRCAEERWAGPLAPAEHQPLTLDLLRQQLGRLGQTPFELAEVTLLTAAGPAESAPVVVPASILNDLRRKAAEALYQAQQAAGMHPVAQPSALDDIRRTLQSAMQANSDVPRNRPSLHLLVRSLEQVRAAADWQQGPGSAEGMGTIYCDLPRSADAREAFAIGKSASLAMGLATARIMRSGEESDLEALLALGPVAMLVRNLAALAILRERCPQVPLIGDASLNLANELSAALAATWGLTRITPGYDLPPASLGGLLKHFPASALEVLACHHSPLFHTEHCTFAAWLGGDGGLDSSPQARCRRQCRGGKVTGLQDRNGARHTLLAENRCRNTIYADQPARIEGLGELCRLGIGHFRIELLDESAGKVKTLLERYRL
ncbi:MAG: DUF3656 domain-containing protein [Phycisphaerae bacterium]|jgi:putative protease